MLFIYRHRNLNFRSLLSLFFFLFLELPSSFLNTSIAFSHFSFIFHSLLRFLLFSLSASVFILNFVHTTLNWLADYMLQLHSHFFHFFFCLLQLIIYLFHFQTNVFLFYLDHIFLLLFLLFYYWLYLLSTTSTTPCEAFSSSCLTDHHSLHFALCLCQIQVALIEVTNVIFRTC